MEVTVAILEAQCGETILEKQVVFQSWILETVVARD